MPVPERDYLIKRRNIMADVYAVAQTYSNAGAAITASQTGLNARKTVVYYPGTAAAAANPFFRFGTPALSFLKVTLTDIGANMDAANSLLGQAVKGVQMRAEVYGTQRIDNDNVVFAVVDNTTTNVDSKSGSSESGTGYGLLEADINAATGGSSTVAAAVFA